MDDRMPTVSVCELLVGSMTCAACKGAVQRSLIKCSGVIQAEVDLLRETARVAYHSDVISPAELCKSVESLGFQAQVLQIFVASSNTSPPAERDSGRDSPHARTGAQWDEASQLPVPDGLESGALDYEEAGLRHHRHVATPQAHDFNELWTMSNATLRLAIADSRGLAVESACSTLKSSKGVHACEVALRGVEGPGTQQLLVTYKPQVVGARELIMKLVAKGFSPSILSEDPLQKQKEAVLGHRRAMLSSLLLSILPSLVVICLSTMARTHNLPTALLRECLPGMRLSTLLLLILTTPVQFYGGRSFHRAAFKGLRHRQFSMDLLVSLGSNLAFFYSALSCVQSAATTIWCRPLLSAAGATAAPTHRGAAAPVGHRASPFYELLENAEPQVFFDTCVMLICIVLLGKLLQLRAKARILEQLHSLHSLQVRTVHLVLRSPDTAVSRCLQHAAPQSSAGGVKEGADTSSPSPSDLLKIADVVAADSPEVGPLRRPPLPVCWWQKVCAACGVQREGFPTAYNPLTQPASWGLPDEGDDVVDGRKRSCCCRQKRQTSATIIDAQNATGSNPAEVIISAELLQAGDVVRIPPQEVLPADGILLAPPVLHVDERLLSGEGRGVCKFAGQRVIGGSRNASHADAFMQVQVVGDASVLQTLLRLVQTGQQQHQPLQKAAEMFAAYFIPIVLCITAGAVVTWAVRVFAAADTLPLSPLQQLRQRLRELELREGVSGSELQLHLQQKLQQQQQQQLDPLGNFLPSAGPQRSAPLASAIGSPLISVHAAAAAAAACRLSSWVLTWDSLLFALRFGVAVCCAACPCAIGLAAPAAVAAATAAAAARGVFFKKGKALEAAANVNCLVVDKTGTLTTGDLRVAACVLHTKRLERLLLPALEGSKHSLQPSSKPSGETCCSTSNAGKTTNGIKTALCSISSSSSRSTNTRESENTSSPSDSVIGSMTDEAIATLEEATPPRADISASTTGRGSPSCCRKKLQGSRGNLERPCLAPLAFCRLDFLWEASLPTSQESSPRSSISYSSTTCSSNGAAHASLERETSPKPCTWHSSTAKVYGGEALQVVSAESAATGCFLWALSCLEQGSSHSVGEALVHAYEKWRRMQQRGASLASCESWKCLGVWSAAAAAGCLPPPQACEKPQLLSRGIEGHFQTKGNLRLRLRVASASPEDDGQNSNDDASSEGEQLAPEEEIQLQEWTCWHERHCGPVVHLHARVAAGEGSETCWGPWEWLGSVALQDEIKHETKLAVEYLRRCLGFRIFMCTGDNPRTASRVGAALSIPEECIVAQQTPEDKVRFLRSLASPDSPQIATSPTNTSTPTSSSSSGSGSPSGVSLLKREKKDLPVCCMVGDGLNDSPALAEAALGVAFGVGNALPLAAAAVAVGGRSWTELVDLFLIARQTRSIIRWNLLWACVFNLVSVPLAAGVAYPTVSLHPAAAAAAMACSCLLVLLNAHRLTRFKQTTAEGMARELSRMAMHTDISANAEEEKGEQQEEKSPQSAASLQLQDQEVCLPPTRPFGANLFALPAADPLVADTCCYQPEAAMPHSVRPLELPMGREDSSFDFSDFEA